VKHRTPEPIGTLVGVISDTHGLLRQEILRLFSRADLIVHAGDVGGPDVLRGLEARAPLYAVRGNTDHGAWADALPESRVVEIAGACVLVLHDVHVLDGDPAREGFAAVIVGQSHRPFVERRKGVLFINPGSAGPRRFTPPVACARLRIRDGTATARIIDVDPDAS